MALNRGHYRTIADLIHGRGHHYDKGFLSQRDRRFYAHSGGRGLSRHTLDQHRKRYDSKRAELDYFRDTRPLLYRFQTSNMPFRRIAALGSDLLGDPTMSRIRSLHDQYQQRGTTYSREKELLAQGISYRF